MIVIPYANLYEYRLGLAFYKLCALPRKMKILAKTIAKKIVKR